MTQHGLCGVCDDLRVIGRQVMQQGHVHAENSYRCRHLFRTSTKTGQRVEQLRHMPTNSSKFRCPNSSSSHLTPLNFSERFETLWIPGLQEQSSGDFQQSMDCCWRNSHKPSACKPDTWRSRKVTDAPTQAPLQLSSIPFPFPEEAAVVIAARLPQAWHRNHRTMPSTSHWQSNSTLLLLVYSHVPVLQQKPKTVDEMLEKEDSR